MLSWSPRATSPIWCAGRVRWSEGLETALGLPKGGFGGTIEAFRGLVHADDLAAVVDALRRAIGGETAGYRAMFCMVRADGGVRWTDTCGTVLRDASGRAIRVVGMDHDITEQRAAEAVLLERKARLRLFIERAPAAIAMFDSDMRYLSVSRRFIADYGLPFDSPAALEGRLRHEVFPNLPVAWCQMHRRVFAGETWADADDLVRPDGRTETVRWEMTPWHRADGSVGGALLFSEVITERKKTEAALVESEARFRALADALPQLVYVASADGVSEYQNQRWFDYSGQSAEQARAGGWRAMLHPDDRDATMAAWEHAIASGETYERGHDGQYRWFLSRAIPWRGPDDGRIIRWLGTSTDIAHIIRIRELTANWAAKLETQVAERTRSLTEAAVELQAEMRRRQDMQLALMQSQKLEALGQLTAGVAHDFNNVLTAISSSFELIERRTTDARVHQVVEMGRTAAGQATTLIRQLLNFGRSESLVAAEVDVASAMQRANELIGSAIGRRITRTVDIEPDVWLVLTDGNQLEVALLNLAVNARDAMAEGGTLVLAARNLPAAQRPRALPLNDYVCIAVQDYGQGMPADVLARATEPFFTTKPEGKGTGLGLAMVHAFARRSGGCVQIDSREGVGTTIEIILPRALVTGMAGDGASADSLAEADADGSATILFVEDDEQVRQITSGYLRDRGFNVIDAANAEAAIVLSHSIEKLDLLLTDVAMPGAGGPELARRLRAERPDLPTLFITGSPGLSGTSGEHVLLKPFTGADLVRAITRRLRWKSAGEITDGGLLRRLRNPVLVAAYLFWRAARQQAAATDGSGLGRAAGAGQCLYGRGGAGGQSHAVPVYPCWLGADIAAWATAGRTAGGRRRGA
jgi:PAS domain S-box-containing protein